MPPTNYNGVLVSEHLKQLINNTTLYLGKISFPFEPWAIFEEGVGGRALTENDFRGQVKHLDAAHRRSLSHIGILITQGLLQGHKDVVHKVGQPNIKREKGI